MTETAMIARHNNLKRRGLPTITGLMKSVLDLLRTAQDNGSPFLALPNTDPRTIRALEERDWIVATAPDDEKRIYYQITGRGLHALKIYDPLLRRKDGLCPRCGSHPRRLRSTGKPAPYCKKCANQVYRRNYQLKRCGLRPGRLCPRCQEYPRFVAASGRVYSYCKRCKNVMHRAEHQHQRAELYGKIQAGEHVACSREGCNQSRYVSGKSVQDYCYQHYREYQNAYLRRTAKNAALREVQP